MKKLTIREFRATIGHLDKLAQEVGEITVTKHGKAVLRILPLNPNRKRPLHRALRAKTNYHAIPSSQHIRDDRDER